MNNQEIIDIYDENKQKTGRTLIRHKEFLKEGEYIIGVQAIIMNSKNEILISLRSPLKEKYPSTWECNGGGLLHNEDVVEGLIREIDEELGIKLKKEDAIYLKTAKSSYKFKEEYLFKVDIDIKDIKFNDNEAVDAKWVTIDEFMDMFHKGEIADNVDFDEDDYKRCLELLA